LIEFKGKNENLVDSFYFFLRNENLEKKFNLNKNEKILEIETLLKKNGENKI
jgi:hypothetical protein